jgi:RHS repeat-associated protein
VTDERGNVKRSFVDAYDRVDRIEEVNGAQTYVTTYQYDDAGSLIEVKNHVNHSTTMAYDLLGRKIAMEDPNMGTWNYAYDLGGNLTSQTDEKGQTITFTYDLQSRMLTKRYPNNQQITWTYDDPAVPYSKGRLTRVVDLTATTKFFYDQLGRVAQTQRILNGVTYTMSQVYDALGRVTSETFPDTESISYSYNQAGWVSAISGYVNSITYNARSQKTQLQYANGVTTNWTYNAQTFRVTNRNTASATGTFQNLSYTYDNTGNITSITDPVYTADRTFTYDALNRLTSATGNFGPNQSLITHNYSYDAIGNILQKGNIVYSYTNPLHPSAVTATSDGKTYTYDGNGNMLTGGNRTYTWDYDNRLVTLNSGGSVVVSEYDYTGMRVEKITSMGTTLYPFSGYQIEPNGVTIKYLRIGIENIASKKSTGEKLFYHNDHLGGVNVVTNASGTLPQVIEYDPWGKISRSEGAGDSVRRFTGQILDAESGLYYYGGRYYDPELGRFVSPDPFIGQPGDPQNHNRYSYVVNNPVNGIDPDGHFHRVKKKGGFFRRFFGSIIGTIVGAIVGILTGNPMVGLAAGMFTGGTVHGGINGGPEGAFLGAFSSAGFILGGAIGLGLTSGIASEMQGGSFGEGFVGGFVSGALVAVAAYAGSQGYGFDFGNTPGGTFASEIVNDFTRGFAIGTIGSLASGQKSSDAIQTGLITGAFSVGNTQGGNLIGHAYGFVASGFKGPEFKNGAFFYDVKSPGWVTLGNAVSGPSGLDEFVPGTNYTYRQHELGHVPLARGLGMGHFPVNALALGLSTILSGSPNTLNPFENRPLNPYPAQP